MDKIDKDTLVVVVTYNRLCDLKACVSALRNQTYKCLDILVVNNGSNDGTKEWLDGQTDLKVINQKNLGGAGGFYAGMAYMMSHDYSWLVLMDDDGISAKNEIEELIGNYPNVSESAGKEVILNALVVNKDDHEHVSFSWARGSGRSNEVKELMKEPFFKDIHPYNGTLIKRSIIEKIGLIKKEMFIWGDEKEYMARAFHNGIGLYTVTSAIHFHPKEKGTFGSILPFIPSPKILLKPQKMSRFYYRNEGYIYEHYPEKKNKMWLFECAYIIRFLTHFEFRELTKFIKYFNRGRRDDYSE